MDVVADLGASPRPYFIPSGINLADLPPALQAAFSQIIQPAYDELVVGASSTLARSAGATLVFLLCLEVLQQFRLGQELPLTDVSGETFDSGATAERDKQIAQHLKLVSSKQSVSNFLFRLRMLRNKDSLV